MWLSRSRSKQIYTLAYKTATIVCYYRNGLNFYDLTNTLITGNRMRGQIARSGAVLHYLQVAYQCVYLLSL